MNEFNKPYDQFSQNETTGSSSGIGTAATRARDKVADKAAELGNTVANTVTDFRRRAADKLDDSRHTAADAIDNTATSLHSGSDQLAAMGHSAADSMKSTANYLRTTDLKGMGNDIQDFVKRYPGPALAAAALLGFVLARGFGNRD